MAKENKKSNIKNLVVGIIIAVLALIGAVTLITGIVRGVSASLGKSDKTDSYKEFIAPVIMNDPDAFDDVINANQSQLISISIWSLLKSGIDPDSFENKNGGMLIPVTLIEEEFTKLFGKDVEPVHQTVEGGQGIQFEYSKKDKAYIIPITGITALYSPMIADVSEKGSSTILTVGYLASEDWRQADNGDMIAPEPVKYMKIYLRKNGDDYYISSIKQTDALETAVTEKDKDGDTESNTEAEKDS